MQVEKGRSEASTWNCAEKELRLTDLLRGCGIILGRFLGFVEKKIRFVGFLERGMRREDAREEAFGRDSSF
uniref:Uncharacterized protein n=1 Tax=Salix viminalis TaxID=40686 RepID=A0A6N2MT59_SALVM